MIWFKTSCGNGTKPNRKHKRKQNLSRGSGTKAKDESPNPRQHEPKILIDRSEGNEPDQTSDEQVISTAIARKTEPARTLPALLSRRQMGSTRVSVHGVISRSWAGHDGLSR